MSKRYPGGIIRKTPQTPSQTSAQGIWDMASVTQSVKENTWPIAGVPDPISKSLRFRASASAYLSRTFSTPTSSQKFTLSCWVKRSSLSSSGYIGIFSPYSSGTVYGYIDWGLDGIRLYDRLSGGTNYLLQTTAVYRDISSWYHIVYAVDTTQSTASNRVRLYVNGVEVTSFSTATYPTQNNSTTTNSAIAHNIGYDQSNTGYFDGYLTEINFIDGQQLTPSSFGGTNDQTGVWQPIAYTGTYGTNGFYLPFSNTASTATLGYDYSGNSNNWTTNNISLTSGSTYDSMVDVPTQWIPYNTAGDTGALYRGNYATWNPITVGTATVTNGNLTSTGAASTGNLSSILIPSSGKWYAEFTWSGSGAGTPDIGIFSADVAITATSARCQYRSDGSKVVDATVTGGYGATYTNGDVIAVAVDVDSSTVTFYKNNASQGAITYTSSNGRYAFNVIAPNSSWVLNANFGQRPFSYTPPTGFKTLCTTNLSTPTIGATASTQANKYFDATLYTGNGSTQSITNSGSMQPDLVWTKSRSNAYDNALYDVIRTPTKELVSNTTGAEATYTNGLTAFNSNGFSLGNATWMNGNGVTFVGWQWKANGSGSSNTAGSITSTVSANTTAGFSIVTYTGNGTNGASIGHGLGVTPAMVIMKARSTTSNWTTYHQSISSPSNNYLNLNTTDATSTATGFCTPSSTLITFTNAYSGNNPNGTTMVAYCFAQVSGYSAFGSFTGNGSTDGPFVFTGFRPRWIMFKQTSSSGAGWLIYDSARNTYNLVDLYLQANQSNAEAGNSTDNPLDFLSNGFKLRYSNSATNQNGATYIYMAFAESPFKYALAR